MRTKALLALAALAIAIPASAQVYSANVVGYVNYTLAGNYAYNHIANPLNAADNSINAIFTTANDGDQILRWDVNTWDFLPTISVYNAGSGTWSAPFDLNPGEGVFYVNTGENPITVTYVGEVIQGSFTNNLVGNYAYNSIGASAPIGGDFTAALAGLSPNDGDQVLAWDVETWDFKPGIPVYNAGTASWSAPLNVAVGEGFMYVNTGENTIQWVRNFTVAP